MLHASGQIGDDQLVLSPHAPTRLAARQKCDYTSEDYHRIVGHRGLYMVTTWTVVSTFSTSTLMCFFGVTPLPGLLPAAT